MDESNCCRIQRPDFSLEGPFGPSMIVDASQFEWHDAQWNGVGLANQVIYEMHIGTFTLEGTWQAASRQLRELSKLGVTVLEMMPINDFCGNFGWGYDGVNFFAPTRLYGAPDDFRGFIDEAHRVGLAVILDVVYNHAGPMGNFLKDFSKDYFTDRYENEWGEASTSMVLTRLRCGSSFSLMRVTGFLNFTLTACAWMPRRRSLMGLRNTSCRAGRNRAPGSGAKISLSLSAKTNLKTASSCVRARSRVTVSMGCGTMTFIIPRWWL